MISHTAQSESYDELLELLANPDLPEMLKSPQIRKELVRQNFYLFWWYYFSHYHKRRIPEYKIEQCLQARKPRVVIIDARDHGKSVVWSCGYPLWVSLTNPFARPVEYLRNGAFRYERGFEEIITQVSEAGALPEKWMRRHRDELTRNERLICDWGYQSTQNLTGGIWSNERLLLRNGASLYSKGTGAQIRGDHPTRVVADDLENPLRAQSPENRRKDATYFYGDLYGALEPESHIIVVGTVVHEDCLINNLYKHDIEPPAELKDSPLFKHRWAKYKYSAIKPDGTPLAPEIWPFESLMMRKAEIPRRIWMMEYMNSPEPSENPIFPSTWLKAEVNGYDPGTEEFKKKLRNMKRITFCDPAAKAEEGNDYTAIVTIGYLVAKERPEVYVLQVKQFRTSSLRAQLKAAFDSWLHWRGRIGFEAIAYQSVLAKTFQEICEAERMTPESIFEVHYREEKYKWDDQPQRIDKASRAHRITHFFELGWIYLNYNDRMTEIMVEEMRQFTGDDKTGGEHNDTVDALVGSLWECDRLLRAEAESKGGTPLSAQIDEDTGIVTIVEKEDRVDRYFSNIYRRRDIDDADGGDPFDRY